MICYERQCFFLFPHYVKVIWEKFVLKFIKIFYVQNTLKSLYIVKNKYRILTSKYMWQSRKNLILSLVIFQE